ncbi:putative pentatricopeptide repeat-containing protein At3g15930 [Amborella trichopoda]|uniref:putative pentatricopeptide repeat-containing protein At3g15930 n=1 Tax=Amborella trichopoda TaxID=13333 RepID=UPI0005D42CE2|nr:putative pentatricopeptide repeat-containing protein At3g15930 [Amborella trichopoda]|eukprot:XP_011621735.1 putative pentatricopeptide repeat-containing protein At3g15930 [Amborella trichopoda]
MIKALASNPKLKDGNSIHSHLIRSGFDSNQFVMSSLIKLYTKGGSIVSARQIFDEMNQPEIVAWTAMINGYLTQGELNEALALFKRMCMVGPEPDSVTLTVVLSVCGKLGDLGVGMQVHSFIEKHVIERDSFLGNSLMIMYAECGFLDIAHKVFDEMPRRTVVCFNSIISQYLKHGEVEMARDIFGKMPLRDVVSWNTMLTGLAQTGHSQEALTLYREMGTFGMRPTKVTMLGVISSCTDLGALGLGMWVHAYVEKKSLNFDGFLDSALIDMYCKCGSIDMGLQLFDRALRGDLMSWTSIICGLASHGHGEQALRLFSRMRESGIEPDNIVFLGVLSACSHAGLVDEGIRHFDSMENEYRITPKIEHYGCMVDLFGRGGQLEEALRLILGMPMRPNAIVWGALLSACKVHNDGRLGVMVAKRLLELEPSDPGNSILLATIYARDYEWDCVMRLRKEVRERGLRKTPGCSSIEVYGIVHEFLVGDSSHLEFKTIYSMLKTIEEQIKNTTCFQDN